MKNKEELAILYSEGSKGLYNCLLELWDNDFNYVNIHLYYDNQNILIQVI